MRPDLAIIQPWIEQGARVLDLGCGDGELLHHLTENRGVTGYGLEIDHGHISQCIARGVNVLEQNLEQVGVSNIGDDAFDVVVMTQALQTIRNPHELLDEMLRVAREGIVTFPNFGHWRCRLYLAGRGRMPVSRSLPYSWYNTPNIHLCTCHDFEALCRMKKIRILNREVVDDSHQNRWFLRLWPNLLGQLAIYRISR